MERLAEALLEALPDRLALDRMLLFKMEADLDRITQATTQEERIFYVVKWAWTKRRLGDLLAAALACAPGASAVVALAKDATQPRARSGAGARPTSGAEATGRRTRAGSAWHLWENGSTLRVRFLEGAPELQARVMAHVGAWTEHANLQFVQTTSDDGDVRVSFAVDQSSWSFVGTQALTIPKDQATVNFGWLDKHTPDAEFGQTVLHEFGHVLGMIHEHQNPNAKIDWAWEALYKFFHGPPNFWSRAEVDAGFKPYDARALPNYRDFDPDSIMMYAQPADFTRDRVAFKGGRVLSDSDKMFAAALYPRDGTVRERAERRKAPPTKKPETPHVPLPAPSGPPAQTAPAVEGKLLFLAAEPLDKPPLALIEEHQAILDELIRTNIGRRLTIVFQPRVLLSDLDRQLLNHDPLIVHYSGHGDQDGRLTFLDPEKRAAPVPVERLAELFRILKGRIRCVFLNACYSQAQADAIRQHIDYVVGMSKAIQDRAAIDFATTFYMALAHGKTVRTAFELGCQEIGLRGRIVAEPTRGAKAAFETTPAASDERVPVLLVREGVAEVAVLAPQ